MRNLFFFIYAQPLPRLAVLLVIALFLWWAVRADLWNRVDRPREWRSAALILMVLWIGAVVWATLLNRSPGQREVLLSPFWSYRAVFSSEGSRELLRSDFMNGLLFLPGGLLLGEIAPRQWRWRTMLLAMGVCGGLSVLMELLQWVFALGLTETDDVIHNTLGGMIGSLPAAAGPFPWAKRRRK